MKFVLSALLLTAVAFSQTFQGSLRGRVVDPAGATASSVQITLIDEATKLTRSTVSNDQGEYVFNSLQPATYTISAESAGFKRLDRKGVLVATQNAVTVDLTLEIGQVSESVSVSDDTPRLQTADASVGQVIDAQKITDLPNLGRNPFFVAKLSQAVVFANNPKMGRMQDQNANSAVSIAGGPLRANNTLVDGVSITDSNNRAVILPSPEAVQELKLQTATYDAEAGRTGGGTFNTVLRSGTNQIHGSAVGYLRQNQWTANTFFANRAGLPVPEQPFKQFAGSIGGPIYIPKLYDGRNKTFFFISTEAYRQLDASTVNQAVPTARELTGDFSQSFNKAGGLQTIYDPLTTTSTGVRTPFVGNIIPLSRLDPIGLKIASYYPSPRTATAYYGTPNYTFTGNFPNRGDQTIWKADHQFTPWLRASGSYIYQKTGETGTPQSFANVATPGQNLLFRRINSTQANATITPTPTMVIAIRWGFNRFYSTSGPELSSGFNVASLGLPQSLAAQTVYPAFPAINMGTLASYGGGTRSRDVYYSRTTGVTVSKFLGRHSLKGGFDFRTLHDAATPSVGPSSLGFTDVFTRPNPASATTGQGSDLATLLLGYPTSGSQSVVTNFDNYVRYLGFFLQDDFRLNSRLTFNIGVRLEYESGVREMSNQLISGFDRDSANPLQQTAGIPLKGVVQYTGINGNSTQTGTPRTIKPGPRFGFAYTPTSKTVVRGGYGISWAPTFFNYQNTIGYSQTTNIITSTNNNFTPAATLANPYPTGLLQPTGNAAGGFSGIGQAITVPDSKTKSAGYVQQYSLEVQHELPGSVVITVGALGSHSIGLLTQGVNINQLNPSYFGFGSSVLNQSVANPLFNKGGVGTVGTANISQNQLWRPFPQFTSVLLSNLGRGDARYVAFYVRGEKRYGNGLTLLASFTRSRTVDNVVGQSLAGVSSVSSPSGAQNAYDLNSEFSLSTQDVPNRFTTAITYELPLGRGKKFLRNSRVLDWIVGGWSINAVNTYQSGYPLSISQPNNNSTIGAGLQRPNATGISPETSGSITQRIDGWINPAAFSQAAQFTFGNVSRFSDIRGPRLYNWDASLFKSITIKERIKAQFRAEAINATNTPYFGNPNTTFTDPQFGIVTSQINYPRLIQLGLRVTF